MSSTPSLHPTPAGTESAAAPLAALPLGGTAGGPVQFDVAVIPRARRTEVAGLHDGALKVRLAAPPVDGRANQALIEWLADELGLPRRAVDIRQGETSRRKRVQVQCARDHVAAWLGRIRPA